VWRGEWLGGRDPHELGHTNDADAIDADGDHPDETDPDGHGVSNDNRGRSGAHTTDDDDLRLHDNVRSKSRRRRCRGCSSCVAKRRVEQHAVGLDRLRDPRGGRPRRRDRLVVAKTLRPWEDKSSRAQRRTTFD
jgi:hypothetical protein